MAGLGADPGRITAVLGPAVCGRCYEVPAELRAEVADVVPAAYAETSWGTPALDVAAGVAAQLAEAGVAEVVRSTVCTLESVDHYS
jgi:copper oxidase (laccase) domain-containing protein